MKKGFTLIELLVVVLIIGVLAAAALPQYEKAVLKSRYTQVITMANAIRQAQDRFFMANGKYAVDFDDLDVSLPGDCGFHNGRKGWADCPKYSCVVDDGWVNAETLGTAYCMLTGKDLGYMASPVYGAKRYCMVYAENETAKKFCLSLGAAYGFASSGIDYYLLP